MAPKDGHATPVDIAFQLAIKDIDTQQRALNSQLRWLEENEVKLTDPDAPPSHSPLRQAQIESYELYVKELEQLQEKFHEHLSDCEPHHQEKAMELSGAMQEYIGLVDFSLSFQKRREEAFHYTKDQYSKLPESDVKNPEGRVRDIHISLQEMMKHDDAEVRDYVAGAYVKRAAEEICETGIKALKEAKGDEVRQELVRFERCLKQLTPEMLPLKMGQKLGPMGSRYIIQVVDDAISQLQQNHTPEPLTEREKNPVRGESGLELAGRMIEDPEIRPAVLTLFTSLQPTHEGVDTDIAPHSEAEETDQKRKRAEQAYYSASVVGLKRIRDEFRLVDMPTMEELLTCAVHDLKSPNSLLATEAQTRHRQTAVDKRGQLRRDKMLTLCKQYLGKEKSEDAPDFVSCRGQSHVNGVMVVHPHRQVLDCFKKGGQVFDVNGTGHTTAERSASGF